MPRTPDDPFDTPVSDDDPVPWPDDGPERAAPEDPFDEVGDDAGTADLESEALPGPPLITPVDDGGGTEDPFDVVLSTEELGEEIAEGPARRRILPWQTTARINGRPIQALLAPSMPTSTWRGGPADASGEHHVVQIADLSLYVELETRPGAPLLVLGRNALEGRILVQV